MLHFVFQNVTDETVEQISTGCPQLEFLCLSNCKEITDQSLIAIGQGCPNIKLVINVLFFLNATILFYKKIIFFFILEIWN